MAKEIAHNNKGQKNIELAKNAFLDINLNMGPGH